MECDPRTQVSDEEGMKENVVRELNLFLCMFFCIRYIVMGSLFIKATSYNISLFLNFKIEEEKFTLINDQNFATYWPASPFLNKTCLRLNCFYSFHERLWLGEKTQTVAFVKKMLQPVACVGRAQNSR